MQQRRDPRDVPRDEEGETVSYSGPCLAELLAASGEHDAMPSGVFQPVESTVKIVLTPPVSAPASHGALAYTVPPPRHVQPHRASVATHSGRALVLAGVGLLIGLFAGTAFSSEGPKPARAFAAPQAREVVATPTPLASPTHQKLATKRKGKGAAAGTVGAPPVIVTPAVAAPADDAITDAQQIEDRKLLLAAAAERAF